MKLVDVTPCELYDYRCATLQHELPLFDTRWLFHLIEIVEDTKSSFCNNEIRTLRQIERNFIFNQEEFDDAEDLDYILEIEAKEKAIELGSSEIEEKQWLENAKRWRVYCQLCERAYDNGYYQNR